MIAAIVSGDGARSFIMPADSRMPVPMTKFPASSAQRALRSDCAEVAGTILSSHELPKLQKCRHAVSRSLLRAGMFNLHGGAEAGISSIGCCGSLPARVAYSYPANPDTRAID